MMSESAAPTQAPKPNTRRWIIIGLLFAAALVNYIDRGNLGLVAVPLMREFGRSAAAMGALLSAFFWSYALLQVPAGFVVDRFGLKWTYAAAFLLWSLASAAVGLASSFEQILFYRLLLGVGEAAVQPVSLAFIRHNFRSEEQGLPTAVYLTGMMLGPAAGALLSSLLLDRLGWRMVFLVTGLGACMWLIPWLLLAPSDALRRGQPTKPPPVQWRSRFGASTLWGVAIGAFFYAYYWYFCLTWLPSYLVMARGFSFLKMGVYTALPFLITGVANMIAGRIADRIIARAEHPVLVRKLFVGAGFLLGSSILLLMVARSSAAVLATLIISLVGIGVATGNYWALTQAVSPAAVIGRVVGAQNTIANAAGICSPIVTGYLVDKTKSFDTAIVFAGASLVAAAAAFLFLVRGAPSQQQRS